MTLIQSFEERKVSAPGQVERPSSMLESVQVMRALACLAVCFFHVLHVIDIVNPSPTLSFYYELPWPMGVDLFFLISGFIMMKTTSDCFGNEGAAKIFFLKRFIRIVPLYWLFTTLMLISTLVVPQDLNTGVFTVPHAVMSYLFIPHFNPRVEGLMQPLLGLGWTLVYEVFFYITFGCCLFLKEKLGLFVLLTVFLFTFITARMDLWTEALNAFWGNSVMFDFLLGILAFKVSGNENLTLPKMTLIIGVSVSVLLFALGTGVFGAERLFHGGVPALVLFVLLWNLPAGLNAKLRNAWLWLVLLGDASYALYLSHPFVITFVRKIVFSAYLSQFGMPLLTISYIVITPFLACVAGIACYFFIDKPITSYLHSALLKRAPAHKSIPLKL